MRVLWYGVVWYVWCGVVWRAARGMVCCAVLCGATKLLQKRYQEGKKTQRLLRMDTSFLGVSGPRTPGFPGVSEGFRGFPSFQSSCGRCKNSIKTYENGKSAPGFPVAEQTPIILLESRWRQEWHGVLVW